MAKKNLATQYLRTLEPQKHAIIKLRRTINGASLEA